MTRLPFLLLLCVLATAAVLAVESPAISINGLTRVPLRAVVIGLNGTLAAGKGGEIIATLGEHTATVHLKSAKAAVDGKVLALAGPPVTLYEATYVPLQLFSAVPNVAVAVDTTAHTVVLKRTDSDSSIMLPFFREKIIFTAGGGLYSMDPNGSGRKQLVDPRSGVSLPTVSPDGEYIAYAANREIVVMRADGGERKAITRNRLPIYSLQFTPDGRQLLFTLQAPGKKVDYLTREDIYLINRDGSDQHALVKSAEGESNGDPAINRDGTLVAFVHRPNVEDSALHLLNLQSGDIIELFGSGHGYTEILRPSFNVEGTKILFCWIGYGDFGHGDIFSVEVDTNKQKVLSESNVLRGSSMVDPIYTPDGQRIIYTSLDWDVEDTLDGPAPVNERSSLIVMNADGNGKRRLTPSSPWQITGISFSPYGGSFAFVQHGDIYLRSLSGGAARRLTTDRKSRNPIWAMCRM